MWLPSIGLIELSLVLVIAVVLFVGGKRAQRLALGIVPCFALAAAATPADPLSMLLVGAALSTAFLGGVFLAPWARA